MTVYTVHLPQDAIPGRSAGLEKAVLVKDGLNWLALLFPLLWLLFARAWRVLGLYLLMLIAILAGGWALGINPVVVRVVASLLGLFIALQAGTIRSNALERRGMPAVDVVSARSSEEAERRFFERWLGEPVAAAAPAPAAPQGPRPGFAPPPAVLGLFPQGGSAP